MSGDLRLDENRQRITSSNDNSEMKFKIPK